VRSYVTERPVEEQVNLREETVHVERRAVDRPVEAGDLAFQEKEIEAVERGEEAVVSKEARVTEEIALRKDVDTRTETVRDTVRKQEIEVEDDRTGVEVERSGTINPARTDR
jgi:stress response protein YsnF